MGAPGPVRTWTAFAETAGDTAALGEALGAEAPEGAVLLLDGPLGAGKTTLAQGVARGCGVDVPVASPTYNLILHYPGRRPFTHVDLFRLADAEGLATLDLDEILSGAGVTCVEWPGRVRAHVVPPYADTVIEPAPAPDAPERRRLIGRLVGAGWGSALAALRAGGAVVA